MHNKHKTVERGYNSNMTN